MNFMLLEETAANAVNAKNQWLSIIMMVVVFGLIFYFMIIRPQKKKQKEEEKLKNSLQIGDEILTIGGFYGRIISLKEDSVVIESQLDHSKQRIARWGIQQNFTVHDTVEEKPAKAKKEKAEKADKE